MITPKVSDTKVVFGPCRLSYTYVFHPRVGDDGKDEKYQTNILIPEGEKATIKAIEKAIEKARQDGKLSKWGGKVPAGIGSPLHDGSEKADTDDADLYEGHKYLNARSNNKPGIVDAQKNQIFDEDEVYSGCWAIVSVSFFPYNNGGNKGIGCGLNNIMKVRDDVRLGGRASAESDFGDVDVSGELDDDDL